MLEYSLIKQHRPRFNIRLRDDKSYPFLAVTVGDEWPRPMVMRGRKRKGVRYFGPYGHAYAIRETLDLLLRTFPLRTCSDNKFGRHERLGRPCLLFHIEKCSGPCVGEIDHAAYDGLVDELLEFLDGDTDTIVRRLEGRDAGGRVRAGVRAGRPPPRPPDQRAQGDRAAADGRRPQRGHRRRRHRRGRPRGRGAGLLRPQGPGRRPQGLRARQGRGRGPRRARRRRPRGPLRRPAARRAEVGAGADRARRPRALRRLAVAPAGLAGGGAGAPAGGEARAAGHRDPQRQRGVHPAPPAPGQRPQRPGPRPQRAAGCPRPARGAPAHRVLRHEPHPGQRLRRFDGRRGGRAAEEVRLPALQGEVGGGQRRLRRHGGGADAPADRVPRRAVATRRPTLGEVLVPAPAPARRRREGSAQRRRPGPRGAGPRRGDPGGVVGQAVRGGLRARRGRPGAGAAGLRGAVHAAAHPRRGPPVRHHLPPRARAASA